MNLLEVLTPKSIYQLVLEAELVVIKIPSLSTLSQMTTGFHLMGSKYLSDDVKVVEVSRTR